MMVVCASGIYLLKVKHDVFEIRIYQSDAGQLLKLITLNFSYFVFQGRRNQKYSTNPLQFI